MNQAHQNSGCVSPGVGPKAGTSGHIWWIREVMNHIIACVWFGVGMVKLDGKSWIQRMALEEDVEGFGLSLAWKAQEWYCGWLQNPFRTTEEIPNGF